MAAPYCRQMASTLGRSDSSGQVIESSIPCPESMRSGGVTPSLDTLRRIAEALGLELVVDLRHVRRSA